MTNINVCLRTDDNKLHELCADILGKVSTQTCTIMLCGDHEPPPKADLYIWDFEADSTLPDSTAWHNGTKLFVVHRMDLPALRRRYPQPKLGVLLKPVTRSTLAAFIENFTESDPDPKSLGAERNYLLQSLIEASLRLQEYDQDRTSFLSRVVHDFRSPLTAISGYCGLLLAGALKPLQPEQQEVLARMQRSLERLSRLADAMLEFGPHARLDRSARLEPGNLHSVVDQALCDLEPSFSEKKISVGVTLSPCPQSINFDAGQIGQVLFNLFENACKYTPRNGTVRINAYPYFWERRSRVITLGHGFDRRQHVFHGPNAYCVDVHDSGPGVPPDLCQGAFDEYKSYSGWADRSGAGLGLAMSKLIMARHNGRIWLNSDGVGAVFSLALPFAPDSGVLQSLAVSESQLLN